MNEVQRRIAHYTPIEYELFIRPDFKTKTFYGEVKLKAKLKRAQRNLVLHAKNLEIDTAYAYVGGKTIDILETRVSQASQEISMIFKDILPKGEVTVHVVYSGKISPNMHGMYFSKYKDGGEEKELLSTQLEANHARELFPCIDEPEAKATFNLLLEIPKEFEAIANTPESNRDNLENTKIIRFETTPLMSTYLLAFVAGELQYKEKKTKKGLKVRVYSTPNHNIEDIKFSLSTAVKMLDFYQDYFTPEYPLPKVDLVAIPNFAAGAMENWGLITFREEYLLVNEAHTSLFTKQYTALVIAHELAHQWFGNLVTMRWWDDLWLNESFASWIEYLVADTIFPKWRLWEQFVGNEYSHALDLDSLSNTHSIQVEVEDPDEINEIFDAISYQKGASVIRMLHNYLGPEDFQKGLNQYLETNQYSNATTLDLWKALEKASQKPIISFMAAWTEQIGYPLVTLENVEKNDLFITQEKFLLSPEERENKGEPSFWPISIGLAGSDENTLLKESHQKWTLDKKPAVLKLNPSETGFFRTYYKHQASFEALKKAAIAQKIPAIDRYGFIEDTFELSRAGYYPTSQWLDVIEGMGSEEDATTWGSISTGLSQIAKVFDEETEKELQKFGTDLLEKQLSRLGWEPKTKEDHFDQLLRPIIISLALRLKDKESLKHAKKLFKEHLNDNFIHPDIRSSVYGAMVREGGKSTHKKFVKMYHSTTNAEERRRLIAGLASFEEPELHLNSLDMITSEEVRLQEVGFWIIYGLMNKQNVKLTWQWLKDHWAWYMERFRDSYDVGKIILSLGGAFYTNEDAKNVEKFFEKKSYPGIERTVAQALERIRLKAAWQKRNQKDIKEYFSKS